MVGVVPSYDIDADTLFAVQDNSFDGSNSFDPLTETTNTVNFHWKLFASRYYGGGPDFRLPDYNSLVLQLPVNALPDMPDLGGDSGYWRVIGVVRHIPFTLGVVPAQETFFAFHFHYFFSSLDEPLP
jgi:hypothetical protein